MKEEEDYTGKKCDYFNTFMKCAISDLKRNGVCFVYFKYQVEELKKRVKKDLIVIENDYGYTINYKR